MCLVDLFILRDLMGEQSPPCASFLSVLNNVNDVANHVNIKIIVVIIIQSITNKVINQIPLRICKQLLIDGLGKSVRHERCVVDLFILGHPERILGALVPVSRLSPSVRIMHISRITILSITGDIPAPCISRLRITPRMNLRAFWT